MRIVLGVDLSDMSAAAVRAVEQRAWRKGTEVRLIAVDDTIAPVGTAKLVPTAAKWVSDSNAAHVAHLADMLQRTATALNGAGLAVSAELVKESPKQVLCDEARRCFADCIFVGSPSSSGGIERLRKAVFRSNL